MDYNYDFIGQVFIVIETGNMVFKPKNIVRVFTNQYAADQYAWDFNEKAKEWGIRQRYAVICRSLCE